ncbi:MAG: coproporphyrinogen III oxidase [Bacteroidetes bacterium B1(2017)]|nr:MAG: coproporphyrinogen III oxidase [Bacteroidetes bacterium B1(2017)]
MAGIYIHIPFCKQACYYCNFHFSTVLSYKEKLVSAIAKELFLRKEELAGEKIETVYFGGGTPSLLNEKELNLLLEALYAHYDLSEVKEFTLEANPDDVKNAFLKMLSTTPINRLSMGIQSFEEDHLKLMNRAHSANEAIYCVDRAKQFGIEKISIDLIYGIPGMSMATWQNNLQKALNLPIDHISSYCLTVESQTVFGKYKERNKLILPEDEETSNQFLELINQTQKFGFDHYEISNFGKPDSYALHNTNYWKGKSYLGAGPGAHSYYPGTRMWNVSNNQSYMKALDAGILPLEKEILSKKDMFNETIMTGLRTMWGVNLLEIEEKFGLEYLITLRQDLAEYILSGYVVETKEAFILSKEGRFLADGIASSAFRTN